jgi:chlorophyllide a reductase subunit Z
MGYAGATYLLQECCNALFDALFHIIPLATEMDKIEPTPAKAERSIAWTDDAQALLDELTNEAPYLVRISVAKRLRDRAERDARREGVETVRRDHVDGARGALVGAGA